MLLLTTQLSSVAQIGIYLSIFIIVSATLIGLTKLFRKYKVTTKEKENYLLVMRTFIYVNSQINSKYKDKIEDILKAIVDSIILVDKYEKIEDVILKKQMILDYIEKYAIKNNVIIDDEFKDLLNQLIDVALTIEVNGKKVEDMVK